MIKGSMFEVLDLYASTPHVYIHQQKYFSTKYGILMGALSIIVMLILSGYFVLQIFLRQNLSVIFNQDSSIPPVVNISNFPLVVGLIDDYGNPLPQAERTFRVEAKFWTFYTSVNETGEKIFGTSIIDIPIEKCNISKHFGEYQDYFDDGVFLSNSYCINPGQNNLTLYGAYGDLNNGFSFFDIKFKQCVNNSKTTNCLDQQSIDYSLSSTYLILQYMDFDIDHQNPSNPALPIKKSDGIALSINLFKRIYDYKKQIIYDTDFGYVFEDIRSRNFFQEDRQETTYDVKKVGGSDTDTFGYLTLLTSKKTDRYRRTYLKFQQLAANIGGVIKGVMIIGQILVLIYTRKLMTLSLIESLFTIDNQDSSEVRHQSKQSMIQLKDLGMFNVSKDPG